MEPVLDVNINPDNPIIGIRSFGSDPGLVAAMHFPGHGDTSVDSHRASRHAVFCTTRKHAGLTGMFLFTTAFPMLSALLHRPLIFPGFSGNS